MSVPVPEEHAVAFMLKAKLQPLEPYPKNNKKPWRCKCLSCEAIVSPSLSSVRNNGGGCRQCGLKKSAKTRSVDEQDAIALMKASNLIPKAPYPGASKPWLCQCTKCGKDVKPQYSSVKAGRSGCIYCAKKKIDPTDAKFLLIEYGFKPLTDYPGANSPWESIHLVCGSQVKPRLTELQQGRGGCKKCGILATKTKQMLNENVARAFFISRNLEPLVPYPGASRPWKSRCMICNRAVSPQYNRVKNGTGCAFCANRKNDPGEAIEIMLRSSLKPLVPYPGSKANWKCKCLNCKRTVIAHFYEVKANGAKCVYCAGRAVDPLDAETLMKSKDLTPLTPYPGHAAKWHCRCNKCGRDVFPAYNSIQQGSGGCKYCAGIYVDAEDAVAFMRENNLEPLEKYPGSNSPWKCMCVVCGKTISPAHSAVKSGQGTCKYCSRKVVDPDDAYKVMLRKLLKPIEPYSRSDGPWKCECLKCGRIVTPAYAAVNGGQGGCKYCASRGIDYSAPSFIYLITHEIYGAHKIGIGNDKTRNNRLKEHKRYGWKLYKSLPIETGEMAEQLEKSILDWIRQNENLPIYLSSEQMPQGGYSETFDSELISLDKVWNKVLENFRHLN